MKERGVKVVDGFGDVWFVSPHFLDTKVTRALNRDLGITRLNYIGNKNGKRNQFNFKIKNNGSRKRKDVPKTNVASYK